MSKEFSVFVNIGGKLNPSLGAAVSQAKTQVNGLAASLAGIGSRINAPFIAANKLLDSTSKRMADMQRKGRNLTMGVSAPAAWFGANLIKDAAEFAKAGNMFEALGGATGDQRRQVSALAQDLAKRYDSGGATAILKSATELTKAGFTFEQARGSLEQVLAASILADDGMTPAEVGASLSKTITQFQMPMKTYEDSMKSSKTVTDRMVYAAVSTVASMKDVAETMKYAGGIASSTGSSLDQVTAIVMSFAKAGVLGSEAGVALRSAIVRMVKMPKGGLAALDRVGMKLGDYTSSRPVTADGVLGGLKADGIDASKAKKQIADILKNRGGKDQGTISSEITKAVQGAIGSSGAVDASKIAETVNEAITVAGSKIDITKFMTDLKAKFDAGIASTGDIAQILEARHISRYMAILRSDLNKLGDQIGAEAEGYSQKQYKIANKGLPAALVKLQATWAQLKNTIADSVGEDLTSAMSDISDRMEKVSKSNPATFKTGVALAAAAVAAGPLLFILGAISRVGLFAMKGISGALMLMLAPIGLVAKGFAALAVGIVASLARVRLALAGLMVLTAVGGAGAGLAALGAAVLAFGRAVLLFPLVALRAISLAMLGLVMNPVGLVITALIVALAALGTWVYSNWAGIKEFFGAFGKSFMEGVGGANGPLGTMVGHLQSAYNWISQLLGPLDESGSKWREWGSTLGGAVAAGVNLVISGISRLIGFLGTVVSTATAAGSAIKGMFSSGGAAGGAKAPFVGNSIGARALGGPVTGGKPYLVGERGPELFVPGATGRIETNGALRRLTESGTTASTGIENRTSQRAYSITNNWTINGADDPRGVADQIDSRFAMLMGQLENEQRGLLSD